VANKSLRMGRKKDRQNRKGVYQNHRLSETAHDDGKIVLQLVDGLYISNSGQFALNGRARNSGVAKFSLAGFILFTSRPLHWEAYRAGLWAVAIKHHCYRRL
jgi:hypothetical protein